MAEDIFIQIRGARMISFDEAHKAVHYPPDRQCLVGFGFHLPPSGKTHGAMR
jgi:hypothetical protein